MTSEAKSLERERDELEKEDGYEKGLGRKHDNLDSDLPGARLAVILCLVLYGRRTPLFTGHGQSMELARLNEKKGIVTSHLVEGCHEGKG